MYQNPEHKLEYSNARSRSRTEQKRNSTSSMVSDQKKKGQVKRRRGEETKLFRYVRACVRATEVRASERACVRAGVREPNRKRGPSPWPSHNPACQRPAVVPANQRYQQLADPADPVDRHLVHLRPGLVVQLVPDFEPVGAGSAGGEQADCGAVGGIAAAGSSPVAAVAAAASKDFVAAAGTEGTRRRPGRQHRNLVPALAAVEGRLDDRTKAMRLIRHQRHRHRPEERRNDQRRH